MYSSCVKPKTVEGKSWTVEAVMNVKNPFIFKTEAEVFGETQDEIIERRRLRSLQNANKSADRLVSVGISLPEK
jgi:hypothetical protein